MSQHFSLWGQRSLSTGGGGKRAEIAEMMRQTLEEQAARKAREEARAQEAAVAGEDAVEGVKGVEGAESAEHRNDETTQQSDVFDLSTRHVDTDTDALSEETLAFLEQIRSEYPERAGKRRANYKRRNLRKQREVAAINLKKKTGKWFARQRKEITFMRKRVEVLKLRQSLRELTEKEAERLAHYEAKIARRERGDWDIPPWWEVPQVDDPKDLPYYLRQPGALVSSD